MKSHVTLEQYLCLVCLRPYDSGSILLDRHLRDRFEHKTVTGVHGLCPECSERRQDGYIALIGMKPSVTQITKNTHDQRSGEIVHIREHVFKDLFNAPVPEEKIAFVEAAVVDILKELTEN